MALRFSLTKTTTATFDVGHLLLLVGSVFWGGFEGYLQNQGGATLLQALGNPAQMKTMIGTSLAYGAVALIMLAKTSILQPSGNSQPPAAPAAPPAAPPPTAPPPAVPSNAAAALMAIVVTTAIFGSLAFFACNPAKSPLLPSIEATVQTDLEAGDSDEQIASDVCRDLGGTSLTDALCADAGLIAGDVIAALLGQQEAGDAGLVLTASGAERAHAYLVRHPRSLQRE